jgi:predicted lipoprotein with Yx(FWY)xxD motif
MITSPSGRHIAVAAVAAALAIAASACGSSSSASSVSPGAGASASTVSTRHSPSLGATVLVDAAGRTLYTLSAEGNGHFICTKTATIPGSTTACTALWHPLIAKGAVTGSGVALLGTGNGFHDVGVWRAATVGAAAGGSSGGSSGGSTGGGGYGYGY